MLYYYFVVGLVYASATFIYAVDVSKCYSVNSENYCFYTSGSVLSWDEAKQFCERRNSTLPIISDDRTDKLFQQFIDSCTCGLLQNRSIWIGAHAQPVNNSDVWHWIDGRHLKGTFIVWFHVQQEIRSVEHGICPIDEFTSP